MTDQQTQKSPEEPFRKKTPATMPKIFNTTPKNPIISGGPPVPGDGGTVITARQRSAAQKTRSRGKRIIRASDNII
jgi:hypothetical protein